MKSQDLVRAACFLSTLSLLGFAPAQTAEPAPVEPVLEQSAAAADPAADTSRITDVVVYPEHAEITRQLSVDAVAGKNRVRFTNLIPLIDANALRATVSEGARIIGTELRTVHLEASLSAEINQLDARIQELADLLTVEADTKARLKEEAAFYGGVKGRLATDMGRELSEVRLSVTDWGAVLSFVSAGLERCDVEERAADLRERQIKKELEKTIKERKDYAGRQPKEMKEIIVSFEAEEAGPRDIWVHYIIDAAAWRPSYDVHLDRESREIQITGYGQVLQWTGEAWNDVKLSLAMSRPDTELTHPEVVPMIASLDSETMQALAKEVAVLNAVPQANLEKWAAGRFKRRQDRETFRRNIEQLLGQSSQELARLGLSTELVQGAMNRLVNRFSSVRYDVPQRETVPFDSSPSKVVTFSARLPAKLQYVATPALGNSVLLQAEASNSSGYPVLEGSVALFVDESFIGSSTLTSAAQNEGLAFGFGPDEGLVVSRKLTARKVDAAWAFRQSQVVTYEYALELENFNDQPVSVEVTDQIPVSKSPEIVVKFLGSSRSPTLDAETGLLRWTLDVGPGHRSQITFSFSVECPVGTDVHWQ
ncbi:MAG: mucoidy inhibitor MuiA family protein [Planctomycetota bacterium]